MEFLKVVIGYARDRSAYEAYMAAIKELRFLPGFTGSYDKSTYTTTVEIVAPQLPPHVALRAEELAKKIEQFDFTAVIHKGDARSLVAGKISGEPA